MKDLTETVKTILKEKPDARDDDFHLIGYVYKQTNPEIINVPFRTLMWYHTRYDLPSFETIRRTRQKLQHDYPELRGKCYEKRINKQTEYIDKFVVGGKL